MDLSLLAKGDVYIDDPYQECKFRFDHAAQKYFARFYRDTEHEVPHTNELLRDALRTATVITRDEYYAG